MSCIVADDCDDGVLCNGSELCVNKLCQRGAPPDCDDGLACTNDRCDAQSDSCVNVPPGTLTDCNDNQIDDACDLEQCVGDPDCDDCNENGVLDGCDLAAGEPDVNGNGLIDACEPSCAADNANCDDGVFCTFDQCINELCWNLDARYGDTAGPKGACGPDGTINLADIIAVLNAFQGSYRDECSRHNMDIADCAPDDQIDLLDILAVLDAFQGLDDCCPRRYRISLQPQSVDH